MDVFPRKAMEAGRFHNNLGFLVIEIAEDEGFSIAENLFSKIHGCFYDNNCHSMREKVFRGDSVGEYWIETPVSNVDLILPGNAWDKFKEFRGLQNWDSRWAEIVNREFPCELNQDTSIIPGYNNHLTECVGAAGDLLNAYLFTCPIENAVKAHINESPESYVNPVTGQTILTQLPNHYHGVIFAASEPGPSPYNTENKEFMKGVHENWFPGRRDKCYAVLGNKSCHGGGARWLFGEHYNQGVEITDAERAFGQFYRSTYADLMKNGESNVLGDLRNSQWSRLSVENTNQVISSPYPETCQLFNEFDSQVSNPFEGFYRVF